MARRGDGIYQRGRTWWLNSERSPMSVSGQIGARPEGVRRRRRGSSKAPLIVMACVVFFVPGSGGAPSSAPASSSVSATATHPHEHDAVHGAAMGPGG
jgi:hypothetical protein